MASSLFLRNYEASMSTYTDAPEVFHRACAYAVFGALLTRRYWRCLLQGGSPPRWTNLWILLVGGSGEERKSTAVRMAENILTEIDTTLRAPDDGSPEGFLYELAKKSRSNHDASTLLVRAEFSTLLATFKRSYAHSLKPLLMDFYDVPNDFKKVLTKTSFTISKPRVAMLGAIATELLPIYSEQDDWLGGFFSRTMLILGTRTRTMVRPTTPPPDVVRTHVAALKGVLSRWRRKQRDLKHPLFDYDAAGAKAAAQLPPMPQEENLRGSLTRGGIHLMKLAAIEQIDENPEATRIGRPAVERAMELVLHWWNTVPDIIDQCYARGRGEFEGDRLAKRIFRYVLKQQEMTKVGVSWVEVMRACAIHSDYMSKAVNSLVQSGMLEPPKTEGEDGTTTLWAIRQRPRYETPWVGTQSKKSKKSPKR